MAKDIEKNVDAVGNKGVDDDSEKKVIEEDIAEKLGTILEHNEGDKRLLARLIADPRVRQILEAEESGKKLILVDEESQAKPDEAKGQESISSLSSSQVDLADVKDLDDLPRAEFAKLLFGKLSEIMGGVVKEGLSGIVTEVEALKGYVSVQEEKGVGKQIVKAREAHKDFDSYKKEMLALSKLNPNLNIEQLYVLAKDETGDKVSAKVETERPGASSSRSRSRAKGTEPTPLGRRGMDVLLDAALEKQDLSELGE